MSGKDGNVESICETDAQSQCQAKVSLPTAPLTRFPEFFELEIESTTCRLVRLNTERGISTAELAESFLAVEIRHETKPAAMNIYFSHLRTTDFFGRLRGVGVGEAAYLSARELCRQVLRIHREKEEVMRESLREIAELEKTRQKEKGKERVERRASGKTLVEDSEDLDVGEKG